MISLGILSAFLLVFYSIEIFELTPKLYSRSKILVPTGRYVQMMILYPTILQLIGDLTTNYEDMNFYSRLAQLKIMLMFINHFVDVYFLKLFASIDFIISILVISKTVDLFNISKDPLLRMLDRNSTILLKTILFVSFTASQLSWIAHFAQVVDLSFSETVCTISDIWLIGGIIITVSFAEIKELEA